MMDKISARFPETWSALERSEAANAMKKKFDELTNPLSSRTGGGSALWRISFDTLRRRVRTVSMATLTDGRRVSTRQPQSPPGFGGALRTPHDARLISIPHPHIPQVDVFFDDSDGDGRLKLRT